MPKKKIRKRIIESDSEEENRDGDSSNNQEKTTLPIPDERDSTSNDDQDCQDIDGPESDHSDRSDNYDTSDSSVASNDQEENEVDVAEARFNSFVEPDPGMYNANIRKRRGSPKKKPPRQKKKAGDDDDENDSIELDSQEVSIHRINIGHKNLQNCRNEEETIFKIIKEYNFPKDKSEPEHLYDEQEVSLPPSLKPDDRHLFSQEDNFKVKIYTQKIIKGIPLLRQYGVNKNDSCAIVVNSLIFHYREGEIFCLTTAQGWVVVQWCSDFTFPGKVAARILSKEGVIASTVKGIVGNELISTKVNRKAAEANPFELLTFCTSFKAELREDASILELYCLKKGNDNEAEEVQEEVENDEPQQKRRPSTSKGFGSNRLKSESRQTKVLIQTGSIRILKRFAKSDLLAICFHLSKIARGEATTNTAGVNESSSTAHEQYLTKVHVEMAKELDLEISKKIHDAVADNGRMEIVENFELNHKYSTDFYESQRFVMSYKGSEDRFVEEWLEKPPTFCQLIVALRGVEELTQFEKSEAEWMRRLNNVRLEFKRKNGKGSGPEKIMNFLQGMHTRTGDNNVFFHVQSIWCYVQHSYLLLLQRKFHDFLKSHLKNDGLKFPWPTGLCHENDPSELIKVYIERYKNLSNFYIVPCQDGTNLADLMELKGSAGKYSLVLYYIFPGLSYSSLSRTSHVSNSIMKIRKAEVHRGKVKIVGGAENAVEMVKKLYVQLRKAKPEFQKAFKKIDEFGKLLNDAKIVIAIGKAKENYFRSLQSELEMETKIYVEDFKTILEKLVANRKHKDGVKLLKKNLNCKSIPEVGSKLHELLKTNEYLADDNEITGKFLCQTRASFNPEEVGNSAIFVFENIILPFLPQAGTFLSKLEWIRLKIEMENMLNSDCEFNLVEIQGEEEEDVEEVGRVVLQDQNDNQNKPGYSGGIRKKSPSASPVNGKPKKRKIAQISSSEEEDESD